MNLPCFLLGLFCLKSPNPQPNFYLYTKDTLFHNYPLTTSPVPIETWGIVAVLIYGWRSNRDVWYPQMRSALFSNEALQVSSVIEVDYGTISMQLYPDAVAHCDLVARALTELLVKQGIPLENVHLIGHSLGAQVAGGVGYYVLGRIGRITGLDPAGPLFGMKTYHRLTPLDAEMVLVVHSDRHGLGYRFDCGTIDVYPNDGVAIQPGCPFLQDLCRFMGGFVVRFWCLIVLCSHSRSREFFVAAVARNGSMVGVECSSYGEFRKGNCDRNRKIDLGGVIRVEDQGRYYLRTNSKQPFHSISP